MRYQAILGLHLGRASRSGTDSNLQALRRTCIGAGPTWARSDGPSRHVRVRTWQSRQEHLDHAGAFRDLLVEVITLRNALKRILLIVLKEILYLRLYVQLNLSSIIGKDKASLNVFLTHSLRQEATSKDEVLRQVGLCFNRSAICADSGVVGT